MSSPSSCRPPLVALAAALAALAAAPPAAHADDPDSLRAELHLFALAVAGARAGEPEAGYFEAPAARCGQVVAALKKAGVKPDDVIEGGASFPFREADARCKEYGKWKPAVDTMTAMGDFLEDVAVTRAVKPGEQSNEELATRIAARGAECTRLVDGALAAGARGDVKLPVPRRDEPMSLREARGEVCQALTDWAKGFVGANRDAREAMAKAARDRYAKHGAAGDRLQWLVYYDPDGQGTSWFLPGCKETQEPARLAKAPVIVRWTEEGDGTQHLRRLQFKGNKLVKDTSRSFLTEARARASGCK